MTLDYGRALARYANFLVEARIALRAHTSGERLKLLNRAWSLHGQPLLQQVKADELGVLAGNVMLGNLLRAFGRASALACQPERILHLERLP